jgi:heterodisulfide reductase subunit C
MDRSPRQLLYLAKEGFKTDVLESFTIWLCTSCYQCTVKCPREIKVTDIMYALKRRAIEEGTYPKRFAIPVLAREFHKMIRSHGRITETRLVLNLMLKTNLLRILRMFRQGRALMRTGRFSWKTESIQGQDQLARLLDALEEEKERAA